MDAPPELSDNRVLVRAIREADRTAVVAACREPSIPQWTMVPFDYGDEDFDAWVEMATTEWDRSRGFHGVAVDPGDGRLLGGVGISVNTADLVGELGYWVVADERRRGVATAASRLLVRWSFEQRGIGRVFLRALVDNPGSNGVAARLGFSLEGTLRQGSIRGHTGDPADDRADVNLWGLLPGELR